MAARSISSGHSLGLLLAENQCLDIVLKLANPMQIAIASSSFAFCRSRFSLRKLKNALAFAMACSTRTRTLASAWLQLFCSGVRGWFLRALVGLNRNRGDTCFSNPLKPESTCTRNAEKSNSPKTSLKIVKSCTFPSYRPLRNKIRLNWSHTSNHFNVCCFFYHYTSLPDSFDFQDVQQVFRWHQ